MQNFLSSLILPATAVSKSEFKGSARRKHNILPKVSIVSTTPTVDISQVTSAMIVLRAEAGQESIWKALLHDRRTEGYAAIMSEFTDLVSQLDDTDSTQRWTLWVPRERALNNEIREITTWPAETRKRFLEHLISPYEFPASELFYFPNVPVLHHPQNLNGRQLLRFRPIFRSDLGPTYSVGFGEAHILVQDITALNGRMHILSHIPPEPPAVNELLRRLPKAAFALLHHAIEMGSFDKDLEGLCGCTMFAPTDTAFKERGFNLANLSEIDPTKLKYLLRCHLAPGRTLYSNMRYDVDPKLDPPSTKTSFPRPVGRQHQVLDSAVKDTPIRIDIDRIKGLIDLRVNHESQVISMDHLASNGVVHVVDRLIVST